MPDSEKGQLELAEMIKGLRAQLAEAQREGADKDIRFSIEDVELELEIAAEQQVEGGVAAKFYVLTSSLKGKKQNRVTQKLKLKLKVHNEVIDPETGEKKIVPTNISGEV